MRSPINVVGTTEFDGLVQVELRDGLSVLASDSVMSLAGSWSLTLTYTDRLSPVALTLGARLSVVGTASEETTVDLTQKTHVVDPLYPNHGANWNDYVKNDGSDRIHASDTACEGTETGGYDACIHGGEARMVSVEGETSCSGITGADTLGAFEWICDASSGNAVLVSTGLADGVMLSDLIDWDATPIVWKDNAVIVSKNAAELFQTGPATWWSNPWSSPTQAAS